MSLQIENRQNAFSVVEFDRDYNLWSAQIAKHESQMRQHVKEQIQNFQGNLLTALLLVKRYEQLHFKCLALDRRYYEIAVKFGEEIQSLKDT